MHARRKLIPQLSKSKVDLIAACSKNGISATKTAEDFNISYTTTDAEKLIKDEDINTLLISTRHDTHASFVLEGLKNGMNLC